MVKTFSLMVHGGAGELDHLDSQQAARCLEAIRVVLEHGRAILGKGGSAMEAVEDCTALLEDDPQFNAGRGSVLNENGKVEMDAAIMDGRDLSAGAVAQISNIANPVRLARLVIARSGHVMLAGAGAMHFAGQCGVPAAPDTYFLTESRLRQLEEARRSHHTLAGQDGTDGGGRKFGTVGAVARDLQGNLAAATSTGGLVNKRWGRVGDSPIIGAGVYADNATCAVSATGHGEDFMRTVLAKYIADLIEMKQLDAKQAVAQGVACLKKKLAGRGGVIGIGKSGQCASGFTTKRMIHGYIERGGETRCSL